MSGANIDNTAGLHALKLHGPGNHPNEISLGTPAPNTGLLANRTQFCLVTDYIFGSSGPWPVVIGPESARSDSLILDVIFEKN